MTSSVRNLFAAAAILGVVGSTLPVLAYDEAEANKLAEEVKKYRFETVTTKEGLKFSIPSDMPIERKDGLVTPLPFDEYLYFKFKKIEEKQLEVDKKVDRLLEAAEGLDKKLDKILDEVKPQKPAPSA